MVSRILQETKPETIYFTEYDGERGAVMIVDATESSKVPSYAEPWFLQFDASIEFHIVMTPDESAGAGLDALGKEWS